MSQESVTYTVDRILTRYTYFELQRNLYGRDTSPDGSEYVLPKREKQPDQYYEGAVKKYRDLYSKGSLRLPKARLYNKKTKKPNPSWNELLNKREGNHILYDLEYVIKYENTDILPNDPFVLYYYFVIRDHKNPQSIKGKVSIEDFIPVMEYAIEPSRVQLDMSRLHPDFDFKMTLKEYILIPLFYIILEKPDEFKKQFENAVKIMKEFKSEICEHFDNCDEVFAKMDKIEKWATSGETTDIDPDQFIAFMEYIANIQQDLADVNKISGIEGIKEIESKYGEGIFRFTIHDTDKLIDELEEKILSFYEKINTNYELEENGFDANNYILGIVTELMASGYYPAIGAGILPASVYAVDINRSGDDNSYFALEYCVPKYWCTLHYSRAANNTSNALYVAKDHQPNGDIATQGAPWNPDSSKWEASIINSFSKITNIDVLLLLKKLLYRVKSGAFDGVYRDIKFSSIKPNLDFVSSLDTAMFHRYFVSHIASHIIASTAGAEFTYKVATLAAYDADEGDIVITPFHAAPLVYPRIRIELDADSFRFHVDDISWAYYPIINNETFVTWDNVDAPIKARIMEIKPSYNMDFLNIREMGRDITGVSPDMTLFSTGEKLNQVNDVSVHIKSVTDSSRADTAESVFSYDTQATFDATMVAMTKDGQETQLFTVSNFGYTQKMSEHDVENKE